MNHPSWDRQPSAPARTLSQQRHDGPVVDPYPYNRVNALKIWRGSVAAAPW